jgi:preprotein translocase subunit SecG
MITAFVATHVVIAVSLVIAVLLQSGKGGGLGGALGGGGANTLFGSSQGGNFFTRLTTVLAVLFMVNSLALTVLKGRAGKHSIFDQAGATQSAPLVPGQPVAANTTAPAEAATPAPTATPAPQK